MGLGVGGCYVLRYGILRLMFGFGMRVRVNFRVGVQVELCIGLGIVLGLRFGWCLV